jgi:hypothetical protein
MSQTTTVGVPLSPPVARARPREVERGFFVNMAYVCALIAIGGFIPSFWAPLAAGTFGRPSIVHLHGLLFSAWPVLFIIQARLALAGRSDRHRILGFAGISLSTAMLFAAVAVVIHSLDAGITAGFEPQARAFAIVPLSIVLLFAGLVAAAIANVRRPAVHMRLMLAASITMLPPAFARILFVTLAPDGLPPPGVGAPPTVAFALGPSFLANGLLMVAMVHDRRTNGRVHPAYLKAAIVIVAVQLVRIPFSSSTTWHAVTNWLLSF